MPFEFKPRTPLDPLHFHHILKYMGQLETYNHHKLHQVHDISKQSQASDGPYKNHANSRYMEFLLQCCKTQKC